MRGFEAAFRAVITRLQQITTANGYHNSLSAIVPAEVWPGEPGSPRTLPYACVVLADTGTWVEQEGSRVKAEMLVPIIAFGASRRYDTLDGSNSIVALRLADDLLRCLLPDGSPAKWDLGTEDIVDVRLVDRSIVADLDADGVPPHAMVTIAVTFRATRDDLGPLAG